MLDKCVSHAAQPAKKGFAEFGHVQVQKSSLFGKWQHHFFDKSGRRSNAPPAFQRYKNKKK